MDFATDAWFLAADQKSVELMSGHVRNVYNYLFSQVTRNIPIHGNREHGTEQILPYFGSLL